MTYSSMEISLPKNHRTFRQVENNPGREKLNHEEPPPREDENRGPDSGLSRRGQVTCGPVHRKTVNINVPS